MKRRTLAGFTLIEVLMALGIVAIALMAGMQATAALTRNAMRQSTQILAQLCAENELIKIRLSQQMPGVGERSQDCEQAGRNLRVTVSVNPTPNPNFRQFRVFFEAPKSLEFNRLRGAHSNRRR